jgi:hypothetical protein
MDKVSVEALLGEGQTLETDNERAGTSVNIDAGEEIKRLPRPEARAPPFNHAPQTGPS